MEINNLTKEVLDGSAPLKKFLREHSCSTNYSFQLKKCSSSTCQYCTANVHSLLSETLSSLSWLPLPLLDPGKDHYKSFECVYGSLVSLKDQPFISVTFDSMEAAAADEQNRELPGYTLQCSANNVSNLVFLPEIS